MNIIKRLQLVFVFVFLVSVVYSATSLDSCCYDKSTGSVGVPTADCDDENQIFLGDRYEYNGRSSCLGYEGEDEHRLMYINNDGECISRTSEGIIFDSSGYKSYIIGIYDFLEGQLEDYDSSISCDGVVTTGDIYTEIEEVPSSSDLDSPPTSGIANPEDTIRKINSCSNDVGGASGLFISENSCEQLDYCSYNPNLAGLVSSLFVNVYVPDQGDISSNLLYFDEFESPCVFENTYGACYDYKTESNCVEDIKNLNCDWVNSAVYSPVSLFTDKSGICIHDNLIDSGKYYDEDINNYANRFNIVKNPSFEDVDVSSIWNGANNSNLRSFNGVYAGKKSYLMKSGDTISQEIVGLAGKTSYSFRMYRMHNVVDSVGIINVRLDYYVGDVLNDSISFVENLDYLTSNLVGYFDGFSPALDYIVIPEGVTSLNLTISNGGDIDVFIDAINLEITPDDATHQYVPIFKSVEILPGAASNCDLCYDSQNLNFCTEEKSDLLGSCEYMVENVSSDYSFLDGFFGASDDNIYLDNWSSQSLSDDLIFCELYKTENLCLATDNVVNSKYLKDNVNAGDSLCKWDDSYGCFKDSDNNDYSDTRLGMWSGGNDFIWPNLRVLSDVFRNNFSSNFDGYLYNSDDLLVGSTSPHSWGVSDFELGCDMLPPNSYVYFTAMNLSGDRIVLTDDFSDLVGDVNIFVSSSDFLMPSCKPLDMDVSKIYIDYGVNGSFYYRMSNVNQYNSKGNIKDFFVNGTDTLIVDGNNDISLFFLDQSGNIGREWNYLFNIDANGPTLELSNLNSHLFQSDDEISQYEIYENIATMKNFSFLVKDYSSVESCTFELNGYDISTEYYNSTPYIETFNVGDASEINFNYAIRIYNNSNMGGDSYSLHVSCVDMFGQSSKEYIYSFIFDGNTDLSLISPPSFVNYLSNKGFLNSSVDFEFASVDRNISDVLGKCSYSFDDEENTNAILNVDPVSDGFNVSNWPGVMFYTNITSTLTFETEGFKNGSAKCEDINGNEFTRPIKYYYDVTKPVMIDFELIDNNNGFEKSVIMIDDMYYHRVANKNDEDFGDLFVSLDATGTWINNSFEMGIYNGSELSFVNEYDIDADFEDVDLSENFNDVDNLTIDNYETDRISGSPGINLNDSELYLYNYGLVFGDKSGNKNVADMSIYVDRSNPSFEFSADVSNADLENRIFTKEYDPVFNLSFNVPNYREFACDLEFNLDGRIYEYSFDRANSYEFSLDLINDGFSNVTHYSKVGLKFTCLDQYNYTLSSEEFILIYDNTAPILEDFYLENGNEIYLPNDANMRYGDIVDALVLQLGDTDEVSYACDYKIVDYTDFYACDSSNTTVEFESAGLEKIESTLVENNYNVNHALDDGNLCIRNDDFELRSTDSDVESNIKFTAKCVDGVDLWSEELELDVKINYVDGALIDFYFEYNDGFAYPVVKSIMDYPFIEIASEKGDTSIITLGNPILTNGIYIYESAVGIDMSIYSQGSYLVWATPVNAAGTSFFEYSLLSSYVVDMIAPIVDVSVLDANNGVVYSDDFYISLLAYDEDVALDNIKLSVNDIEIFSYDGENLFVNDEYIDNTSVQDSFSSSSGVANAKYSSGLIFKDSVIGNSYNFVFEATDVVGNYNVSILSIDRLYGLGISLENIDSESYVGIDRISWLSKKSSPKIKFTTSDIVDSCTIYPFVGAGWTSIFDIDRSDENKYLVSTNTFEFDLSSFEGFDISNYEDISVPISISCVYEGITYGYVRYVNFLNYLPDYTLESSNGFYLNEAPYTTKIDVISVGPYRNIACNYYLDGEKFDFGVDIATSFTTSLDFTSFNSGNYDLELECVDVVGNVGYKKKYAFEIDKDSSLEISDLKVIGSNNVYDFDNGLVYVGENSNLGIEFGMNKKDVDCSVHLVSGKNVFNNLFYWLGNVFNYGSENLDDSNGDYIFNTFETFNFDDGVNSAKFTLMCEHSDSSKFEKEYNLIYDNSILNYTIAIN